MGLYSQSSGSRGPRRNSGIPGSTTKLRGPGSHDKTQGVPGPTTKLGSRVPQQNPGSRVTQQSSAPAPLSGIRALALKEPTGVLGGGAEPPSRALGH